MEEEITSEVIEQQIQEFLARGGEIEVIPSAPYTGKEYYKPVYRGDLRGNFTDLD